MKLIVGLGNPGKEYDGTFHNVGFLVADALVEALKNYPGSVSLGEKKHALYRGEDFWFSGTTGTRERIFVQKPLTYMNESGTAVKEYLRRSGADMDIAHDVWVVHDDGDIELGRVRVDAGKRSAGHRGIASIIDAVGTPAFVRFRVGIRPAGEIRRTEEFILKKPRPEDKDVFEQMIVRTAKGVGIALQQGIPKAQMFLHSARTNT